MKTFNKKLKIYLLALGIVFGGTIVAQTTYSNMPPEENPPLAVEKIDKSFDKLKIFAVNGELTISYEYPENGKVKIRMFDISGKEIMNKNIEKSTRKFELKHDVKSLSSSIYIVRILQDNKLITRKLYI